MMSSQQNKFNGHASYQNIVHWWLIFVLLDAITWGVIMNFHSIFISDEPQLRSLHEVWLFPVLGVIGKMGLLQSPCILILACFYRKRLLLLKRYWCLLPTVSFFVGFGIILVPHFLVDGLHETIRWFMKNFINFRDVNSMMIPMSPVSTIVATVPWAIYLERRFRDLKR